MTKISKKAVRFHTKASEKYIDVVLCYDNTPQYSTSIPIEYRRTGTEIADDDVDGYLEKVYEEVNPSGWVAWNTEQRDFWAGKPKALTTKPFFDVLSRDFNWCCATCTLPKNSNFARRIQDIKEFGYTLATDTRRYCKVCELNTTQIILIPLKRGGITGYETWSPTLRNHIVQVLGSFDAYEAKTTRKEGLLPDHHFPEIRWDANTRRDSLKTLSDVEIKRDFQLISNQRNQQKREVCRNCFQTGERGTVYGIPFFYNGTRLWDANIPKTGKNAEAGCIGCGWYDIDTWRIRLTKLLQESS